MIKPEDNERLALHFIYECVSTRGYPPSTRELMDKLGHSSTSTAHGILHRLVKQGLVSVHVHESGHRLPRAIAITPEGLEQITRTEAV